MRRQVTITVTPGRFRIASVTVVHASRSVLILEADCHSKYPGETAVWSSFRDHGPDVLIRPGERSLGLDEARENDTIITLPPYTGNWSVLAEGRRYTVRIVAYKQDVGRLAWQEEAAS